MLAYETGPRPARENSAFHDLTLSRTLRVLGISLSLVQEPDRLQKNVAHDGKALRA